MNSFLPLVLTLLMLACYLAPWIVSKVRDHDNSLAIFWLNFLLGWTGLGWVAALIWSLTAQKRGAA
jgi:hypothetical protein